MLLLHGNGSDYDISMPCTPDTTSALNCIKGELVAVLISAVALEIALMQRLLIGVDYIVLSMPLTRACSACSMLSAIALLQKALSLCLFAPLHGSKRDPLKCTVFEGGHNIDHKCSQGICSPQMLRIQRAAMTTCCWCHLKLPAILHMRILHEDSSVLDECNFSLS